MKFVSPSIVADTERLERVLTSVAYSSREELVARAADLERQRTVLTVALARSYSARVLVRDERDAVAHELRIIRARLRDMEVS